MFRNECPTILDIYCVYNYYDFSFSMKFLSCLVFVLNDCEKEFNGKIFLGSLLEKITSWSLLCDGIFCEDTSPCQNTACSMSGKKVVTNFIFEKLKTRLEKRQCK